MLTRNPLMALTLVGSLVLAGGVGNAMAQEADEKAEAKKAQVVRDAEVTTIKGKIVDLHHYLTVKEAGESESDEGLLRVLAADMPIALVAEDEGLVDKVMPGKHIHLIIFNPEIEESKSGYSTARELVGERVAITGKTFDRHGLHAISVLGAVELAPETADDETRADANRRDR